MTKAKTREQFIKAWEEEFDVMAMLSESLPIAKGEDSTLAYLNKLRELRLRFIALAVNHSYGEQFCRYCVNMRDLSNGLEGANATGFHCALDLVKNETGDLTAATCEKYEAAAGATKRVIEALAQDRKVKRSEIWTCNRCGREHEISPTFCGSCGNDQFTKKHPKGCTCGSCQIKAEDREHDSTEDLPKHEEDRADYLEEPGPQE